MLEHERVRHEESLHVPHLSPRDPVTGANSEALRSIEFRIEDYLDHVMAPLIATVPFETRHEARADMRAHIYQLIEAHEELGSDQDEAVTAALRQFGSPAVVAHTWLAELPVIAPEPTCREPALMEAYHTHRWAVKRLAGYSSAWILGVALFDRQLSGPVVGSVYLTLGAVIPFVLGYVVGRRFPTSRPALGMLISQACILPLTPLALMAVMNLTQRSSMDFDTGWRVGVGIFSALAPVGCLGAWIGARMRHNRHRKRAAAR